MQPCPRQPIKLSGGAAGCWCRRFSLGFCINVIPFCLHHALNLLPKLLCASLVSFVYYTNHDTFSAWCGVWVSKVFLCLYKLIFYIQILGTNSFLQAVIFRTHKDVLHNFWRVHKNFCAYNKLFVQICLETTFWHEQSLFVRTDDAHACIGFLNTTTRTLEVDSELVGNFVT